MKYKIIILILLLGYMNSFGQDLCFEPDASIWENTWQSCQTSPNPNPQRGMSHWIQYDLGRTYELGKTHIWNHNQNNQLGNGFREVLVDYSEDGINWIELGEWELEQGTGEAIYGGFAGPDFGQVTLRYIVITALSNWGGNCYGLAEVKFNINKKPTEIPETECNEVPLLEEEIPEFVWCYLEEEFGEEDIELQSIIGLQCGEELVELYLTLENGTELLLNEEILEEYPGCFEEDEDCLDIEIETIADLPDMVKCFVLENFPDAELTFATMTLCDEKLIEVYIEIGEENEFFFEEEALAELEEDCEQETTSVSTSLFEQSKVKIYPNPAQDQTFVLIESPIANNTIIQLLNVNGQVVWKNAVFVKKGENKLTIPLQNLGGGIYVLSIQSEKTKQVVSERLVVLEKDF